MSISLFPRWQESMRVSDSETKRLSVMLAEKRADIIERGKRADRVHHRYAPLYTPSDGTILDAANRLVDVLGTPKLVVLIGIGGSSLAVEAVADALGFRRRLVVFDTLVPERVTDLDRRIADEGLDRGDIALIVASKSGTTPETLANLVAVRNMLESKFGDMRDRIVAISDDGSSLDASARERGWRFAAIPKAVGGRYSAFSAAGIVPLALLGVDVKSFVRGAREELARIWASPILSDTSSILAAIAFLMHEKGIHQEIDMLFSPKLETLGKWRRQLIAESTGKTKEGKRVGILPHVAVGTTDLHSIQQYISDGPRDLYVVLHTLQREQGTDTAKVYEGKTLTGLKDAIVRGLEGAYKDGGVPNARIVIPDISEGSLGAYMAISMESTILLGHLLSIDPFDQPGVEAYKTHTRALLGKGA